MSEILFLKPVFKEAIWGGKQLRSKYGYDIPSETTGECWAISAHKNGDCLIENGIFAGKSLSWLWENHREVFNNEAGAVFPLLVKIIDAKGDLSIQVHPDDVYAGEHENGSLGKTECWYVLDCEKDATIIVGHNAKNKAELSAMIEQKQWDELIHERPIKKGDFFQIEPGCVHAIKGGTVILETQQSSDITYRLYDYDRLSDGQPRELHIEKSIDVITCPYQEVVTGTQVSTGQGYQLCKLVESKYYTVYKMDIDGEAVLNQDKNYQLVSVINGQGKVNGVPIKKGSHFILPVGIDICTFEGKLELIVSHT